MWVWTLAHVSKVNELRAHITFNVSLCQIDEALTASRVAGLTYASSTQRPSGVYW